MKLPLLLVLPLAACVAQEPATTIVSSVTPEQRQACVAAAASARDIPEALVTATSATATESGPVVNLEVGGRVAVCKLDELGSVENVTFGSNEATFDTEEG